MTQEQLEQAGWAFDASDGRAEHTDGRKVQVHADQAPLFFLIRAVSHVEGDDSLMDAPVIADTVAAVSGEPFTE